MDLRAQLDMYNIDVSTDGDFLGLTSITKLEPKIMEFKKADLYLLVYQLIKLVLILSVTMDSIESSLFNYKIIEDNFVKKYLIN